MGTPAAIDYTSLAAQSRTQPAIDYGALATQSRSGAPGAAARSGFAKFLDSVTDFASEVNPVKLLTGTADTVRAAYTDQKTGNVSAAAPAQLAKSVAERNLQSLHEAEDAWHKGNYSAAALHAFNYLAPFGSSMDDALNDAEKGDIAKSLGKATALGVNVAIAPKIPEAAGAIADAAEPALSAIKVGAKAAAPDVAIGTAKAATGATLAAVVPGPPIIRELLGAPSVLSGARQIGKGVSKGVRAGMDAYRGISAEAPVVPEAAAPVARTPRGRVAKPTSTPAPEPLVTPAPGYATRSDTIPSEYGVLPPVDRAQYFRPLAENDASGTASAPVAPPGIDYSALAAASRAVETPAAAPAAVAPEAELLAKSRAKFDAAKAGPAIAALAPVAEPAQPVSTRLNPAQPVSPRNNSAPVPPIDRSMRLSDIADAHDAYSEMQGESAVWANRARKADRFAKYLAENSIEPTLGNISQAAKVLAEREVPSPETIDMIHDRMNYTAPEAVTAPDEPLKMRLSDIHTPDAAPNLEQQLRDSIAAVAEKKAAAAPKPGTLAQLSPDSIHADPVRFQFKRDAGGAAGVSDKLKALTAYDPELGGKLAVWLDPADGKTYVVNGHHRLELAKRAGAPTVDVGYIDAPNAMQARAKGALINIAEDQGTPLDAAKLFRDTGMKPEDLIARNISLNGRVARSGMALANLEQGIFDKVVSGEIPTETASAIGELLPGRFPDQRAVVDSIAKAAARGKNLTPAQISESIRVGMRPENDVTVEDAQGGLFGSMAETRSLFAETGELSDYIRRQLADEKRTFGSVSTADAADRLGKAGNSINAEENLRIAGETKQAQEVYRKLSGMAGPVSDALAAGARKLALDEGNSNAIKQATYDAVRKAVSETFGSRKGSVPARLSAAEEAGSGEAAQRGVDLREAPGQKLNLADIAGDAPKKSRRSKK